MTRQMISYTAELNGFTLENKQYNDGEFDAAQAKRELADNFNQGIPENRLKVIPEDFSIRCYSYSINRDIRQTQGKDINYDVELFISEAHALLTVVTQQTIFPEGLATTRKATYQYDVQGGFGERAQEPTFISSVLIDDDSIDHFDTPYELDFGVMPELLLYFVILGEEYNSRRAIWEARRAIKEKEKTDS